MTEQEIHDICKKYRIRNYTINPDGSIDVDGNVYLNTMNLTEIPLKFNKVSGSFDVSNNKLTSLEGSPDIVDGTYYCSSNIIKDLNGITTKIKYSIRLYNNPLQSLNGCIISYRKIQIEESLKLKLIRKQKLKLIEKL